MIAAEEEKKDMRTYTIKKTVELVELGQLGVKWEDLDKEYIKTDKEVPMSYMLVLPQYDDMAVYQGTSTDKYLLMPESFMKPNVVPASTETLRNLCIVQEALDAIADSEDMKNYSVRLDIVDSHVKAILVPKE